MTRSRVFLEVSITALVDAMALRFLTWGLMPPVPVTTPRAIVGYVRDNGAIGAAAGFAQLVALGVAIYVACVVIAVVAVNASSSGPAVVRVVRAATIGPMRRWLPTVAAASMLLTPRTAFAFGPADRPETTVSAGPPPGGPPPSERDHAELAGFRDIPPEDTTTRTAAPSTTRPDARTAAPPNRLPHTAPPATPVSPPTSAQPRVPDAPARTPAARPPAGAARPRSRPAATWTVEPGDHLWHIAAATIELRTGRVPDDDAIVPYWRRLIAANTDLLVDPSNPDLILPGQVFRLP